MPSSPNRERRASSSRTNRWENVLKLDALVAEYDLRWSRDARKELDRLPQKIAERVYEAVSRFQTVPRPPASLKLKGGSGIWRFRIGDYRILYMIDDGLRIVSVLAVRHRKDVYRDL